MALSSRIQVTENSRSVFLKISGDIPEEVKKYEIEEIFEEEAEAPTDFTGKDISLLLRKEKVALRDDLIIGLSNSWVNEGWNGPQSFGGYLQLDGYRFSDKGNAYYDFTFADLKDILKDKDHCFDENTTISLEGSEETGFNIILPLKKRDMLKGIRDSSICTSLVEDVQTLFELEYETHEDYLNRLPNCSLRLETIKTIEKYFDEYEEFMQKRYRTIIEKADVLLGSKAMQDQISIDEDLDIFG